jgi:hypothetical protein
MCLQEMICVLTGVVMRISVLTREDIRAYIRGHMCLQEDTICAYRGRYLRLQKLHSIRRSSDFTERGHVSHGRPSDLKVNPFINSVLGHIVSGIPLSLSTNINSRHSLWPRNLITVPCSSLVPISNEAAMSNL